MKSIDGIKECKDKNSLYSFLLEAKAFLGTKKWCRKILDGFIGLDVEGILAVFFFKIEPERTSIDSELWVIVGDIPPAYIVTDNAKTAFDALLVYTNEIQLWIDAVRAGGSVDSAIPVNVPPEKKYAIILEKRIMFIRNNIIPELRG